MSCVFERVTPSPVVSGFNRIESKNKSHPDYNMLFFGLKHILFRYKVHEEVGWVRLKVRHYPLQTDPIQVVK